MTAHRADPSVRGSGALPEWAPNQDVVALLSLYLVILYAVPAHLVVGPLGGAGSPSQIAGLAGLLLWATYHLGRSAPTSTHRQPIRLALLAFLLCVGISYVVAMLRPIPADEVSTADLAILAVLSWSGILLLTADGIPSHGRLTVLIERLAIAAGLLAAFGIVQFFAGESFIDRIDIPGLTSNGVAPGAYSRDQFTRPSGTAVHPIEYGVIITTLLPFALHRALHAGGTIVSRWLPVGLSAIVIPLSLSRSAILGALVGLVVLLPTWPQVRRNVTAASMGVIGVLMFVTVPGLLGTVVGLFTGIAGDGSAQSRTGSYQIAADFIGRAPIFGRGLGTFLPRYRILDNQLLGILIELGTVGIVAFLGLVTTGIWTMVLVRRQVADPRTRDLAQTVIASLFVSLSGFALYDGFAFPMATGTFFLVLGIAGAIWRLERPQQPGDG